MKSNPRYQHTNFLSRILYQMQRDGIDLETGMWTVKLTEEDRDDLLELMAVLVTNFDPYWHTRK